MAPSRFLSGPLAFEDLRLRRIRFQRRKRNAMTLTSTALPRKLPRAPEARGARPVRSTPAGGDLRGTAPGDLALVDLILEGDGEAFAILVERYGEKLLRTVYGIVGDWHLSEDVVQEVFVLVHRKLGGFDRRSTLLTWLYRVAVNAALKARSRVRRRPLLTLEEGAEAAAREPEVGRELESRELADKLLRCLPPKLRVVVLLREWEGLGYDEIGRVLKCSRGAVEQRLHRAMVELRRIWQPVAREEWFNGR
jgi:RNA polymerase sigma-70 factor (ECF subfamily)